MDVDGTKMNKINDYLIITPIEYTISYDYIGKSGK
jgi:hypothetical protein